MDLKKILESELEKMTRIGNHAAEELINVPEGTLRLGKCRGHVQYYHCMDVKGYLSKNDMELARQLAQKSYNEKILRYSRKVASRIESLLKVYENNKIDDIYLSEHPARQKLIIPVIPTYEQKLEKWMSIPYIGKGFSESAPLILTNRKNRVRSKSEKILADYFDSLGIKYKYECPLQLRSYGTVYPDFTFLSSKTGKEMYWEHEGMMDNPDYARTAVQKIETYAKNGIYLGECLIMTFETSTSVINTELVEALTTKHLL